MNGTSNCSTPSAEYQLYFFPIVYSLALLIGLPGNVSAFIVFAFRTTPRTPFSVFISNLALADILILCTLPFKIHYHINKNDWVFGDVTCCITGILFYANIYMSIFFMTCICVDRYLATVHPHTYLRLNGFWCSVVASVVMWAVLSVAIVVFVLMGPLETKEVHGGHSCFENFAQTEWDKRLAAYSLLSLIFGSLLPTIIILVCYPLVARRISKIKTKTAKKAVRVINIILVITVLCFLPNHVVYLLHLLYRMDFIRNCTAATAIYQARRATIALVILNTCLDPVMYFFTTGHCKWRHFKMSCFRRNLRKQHGVNTIALIE